jgi:hypothetical protein
MQAVFSVGVHRGYMTRPTVFCWAIVHADNRLITADCDSQMTDPSSRQRERPTSTSLQLFDSNKDPILSSTWVFYSKTDRPTDRRSSHKMTLTLTVEWVSAVQLGVQLRRCNQRVTKTEESPLLRFVTRKRLVKTLQRNSHCGEVLPRNDQWKQTEKT